MRASPHKQPTPKAKARKVWFGRLRKKLMPDFYGRPSSCDADDIANEVYRLHRRSPLFRVAMHATREGREYFRLRKLAAAAIEELDDLETHHTSISASAISALMAAAYTMGRIDGGLAAQNVALHLGVSRKKAKEICMGSFSAGCPEMKKPSEVPPCSR